MGIAIGDLKALMGRHDITQCELGNEMGIDQTYVSAVMRHALVVDDKWQFAAERIAARRLEPAEVDEGAEAPGEGAASGALTGDAQAGVAA